MNRLVIDISDEQHQQLFPVKITQDEQLAWKELQAILTSRITNAEQGSISKKSFQQITDDAIKECGKV